MFATVIIGVDGPDAGRDALRLAQQLGAPHAQLTLGAVEVVPREPWPPSGDATEAAHARRAFTRLESLRDESHVDAQLVFVEAGSVAAGLHELAVRRAADVLVIGASRADELLRSYGGDQTHAVLENAPCAVAVAPLGYATRPTGIETIGAAYDGSPESEQALEVARELARERGAEPSAFEAVPEPPYVHSIVNPQPEIDASLAQARERIAGHGVEAHAASADDAVEALARYGASVDLLVLGSHRYRPIDRLLSGDTGSTAQRLADIAPCPLLVLPRDDRSRRS
jgi:nucleotide-binding universal stress UspA family protein